jgi:hypothetical protein
VVQAHAPVVIDQLKAGRFVAAVWANGDSLSLILCHPNLAKGEADTIVVNPDMLPRLTIKLGTWDEARPAVGMFLRAFGSEAATPEDCAAARRDLAAWLASRSQPEMAAVTRHYSAFPFGVKSDAIDVINIWRQVLVNGEKDAIDKFLSESQSRFERLGWLRDTELEKKWNAHLYQINRFYCWVGGLGPTPQVMLCLNRATERRVRGGTYDVLDHRVALLDVAKAVQQVLGEVLEPAASAAGLQVTYPHLGPISRVGGKTAEAMAALAEISDGQWPLQGKAALAWRTFVQTAYREEVAIKPEELTEWCCASGWSAEASAEMTKQFYADVAQIAEYEEEGRQAAWR